MKVSEIMSPDFEIVPPDATVDKAARMIAETDLSVLPVGDVDKLQGIITERDITVRVVAVGAHPAETKVADVMSSTLVACHADDDADTVAEDMRKRRIEQMPVLDAAGKMVGVITVAALARTGVAQPDEETAPRAAAEINGK